NALWKYLASYVLAVGESWGIAKGSVVSESLKLARSVACDTFSRINPDCTSLLASEVASSVSYVLAILGAWEGSLGEMSEPFIELITLGGVGLPSSGAIFIII